MDNDPLTNIDDPLLEICYDLDVQYTVLTPTVDSLLDLNLEQFLCVEITENYLASSSLVFHMYQNTVPMIIQTFQVKVTPKEIDDIINQLLETGEITLKNNILKKINNL